MILAFNFIFWIMDSLVRKYFEPHNISNVVAILLGVLTIKFEKGCYKEKDSVDASEHGTIMQSDDNAN